jgi:hypothetical protein
MGEKNVHVRSTNFNIKTCICKQQKNKNKKKNPKKSKKQKTKTNTTTKQKTITHTSCILAHTSPVGEATCKCCRLQQAQQHRLLQAPGRCSNMTSS